MEKLSFFSEAADYLSLISKDYKFGIPESADEISLIKDFSNGISLSGSKSSELLFVTSSKTNCVNEFLESKDGLVLASLIKNALNLTVSDLAFLLITSDVDELQESHLSHIKSIKKVLLFGEEFSSNEFLTDTEQFSLFNSYSLQEIRNSKSVKKDFWSKFKVFYES